MTLIKTKWSAQENWTQPACLTLCSQRRRLRLPQISFTDSRSRGSNGLCGANLWRHQHHPLSLHSLGIWLVNASRRGGGISTSMFVHSHDRQFNIQMWSWTELSRNHGKIARHYETTPSSVCFLKRKAWKLLVWHKGRHFKAEFKNEFFVIIFSFSIPFCLVHMPCKGGVLASIVGHIRPFWLGRLKTDPLKFRSDRYKRK